MVEVLAKDQFVDALPDEDMCLHIRENKPTTLRDAIRLALELESYQLASRQRKKLVREPHLEEGPTATKHEWCRKCKERGHWRHECPQLQKK